MLCHFKWMCDRFPTHSAISLILTSSIALLGVGCVPPHADNHSQLPVEPSANTGNELTTLNIAILPSQNVAEQRNKLKPLTNYLQKTLGRSINLQIPADYNATVDLVTAGKVDIAYLGPLTYVQARQKNPGIQPIVAAIDKTTGRPWYTSIIVVNSSKIKTLEDLKGKRFGFVSKSSTTGYLVPLAEFKTIGLQPEQDFASVEYTGNHDKSEVALVAHEVDAIATDKPSFLLSKKSGKLNPQKYQVIWESDPIPQGPIVVSSKFPSQLILPLKKAFISASEGLGDVNGAEAAGYTLVEDEDYNPVREIQKHLEVDK